LAEEGTGTKLKRLGIYDEYPAIGYPEALYGRYNIDSDGMLEAIAELRKNGEF
jgi:transketolase